MMAVGDHAYVPQMGHPQHTPHELYHHLETHLQEQDQTLTPARIHSTSTSRNQGFYDWNYDCVLSRSGQVQLLYYFLGTVIVDKS